MNIEPEQKTDEKFAPNPVIEKAHQTLLLAPPDKRRHFLAVFFLSFMFGVFGVDRFYLGKYGTGFLKLISFGGFGLWAMTDMSIIMSGAMRDKDGNELIDFARYRKFARNFLLIFSVIVLLLLVLFVAAIVFTIMQFMNSGGLDMLLNLTPGVGALDLDMNSSNVNSEQVLDQLKSLYNGN